MSNRADTTADGRLGDGNTFPALCPGFSVGVRHPQTGVRWHGDGPGLPWRGHLNVTEWLQHLLIPVNFSDFLVAPTPRGLVLSHFGLDHVGLDGAAVVQLVVICDGAASPLLQVQEGVWRLGALWSLANAGQGVRSHVPVDGSELLVTTRAIDWLANLRGGGQKGLQTSADKTGWEGKAGTGNAACT